MTSMKNAAVSVSCAAVCLHSEEVGRDGHAVSLFRTAAEEGKLEILKWGEDSGYELKNMLNSDTIIEHVMLNGHLEVVKYLRSLVIPWDRWTCANVALNGHLELLKWARTNQCPWDEWTCAHAALNGHLELLKWARAKQCPWDEETYALGKENGNPDLMQYLEDEGCPM